MASRGAGTVAARLLVRANVYPTSFGDPAVGDEEAYSRAAIVVPIRAPVDGAGDQDVPADPAHHGLRGARSFHPAGVHRRAVWLGITALLTLVALQLAGGASLPEVGDPTMVDKVYLASYGVIMLVLVRVVRSSWRDEDGERAIARSDRLWFVLITVVYVATLAAIGRHASGMDLASLRAATG